MSTTDEATDITFEQGYARLQQIAGRLNEEEVPVSEMCSLFAQGKGLEQALTGYLDTQRSRVESIERGEGIQAFRITAPEPEGDAGDGVQDDIPFTDFEPVSSEETQFQPAASSEEDEIPF